jgi:CHAD domain-containing protein
LTFAVNGFHFFCNFIMSRILRMELDYVKLKEIKPSIAVYIRESQLLLKRSGIPDEKAVHDIRVLMKKSRALMNLIAPQIIDPFFNRDLTDLREVGRMLRSRRETSVQRKILKVFRKEYQGIFSKLHENEMLKLLLEKKQPEQELSEETATLFKQIDNLLNKTAYRIRFETMNRIDPQLLIKELEHTYLNTVDAYLSCRNNPKKRMLHNFRKKAKDFLYQLYVFRPLNPSVVKSLEKKLDNMTQNLGRYNDIAQIISDLGYHYKNKANAPALDELILKFREAQDKYLAKVWPTAYEVFCPGQLLVNVLGFKLLVI